MWQSVVIRRRSMETPEVGVGDTHDVCNHVTLAPNRGPAHRLRSQRRGSTCPSWWRRAQAPSAVPRANGIVAFKGIPYGDDTERRGALPPAATRRSAWSGRRATASTTGRHARRSRSREMTGQELPVEIETMIGVWNHERRTGEDCLVLNVWTPQDGDDASRARCSCGCMAAAWRSGRRRGRSTTSRTWRATTTWSSSV